MATTLLPFLYHTRTILRANPQTAYNFARSLHTTHRQLRARDDIPFVSGTGEEHPPPEPGRRGTITPSERQIFERIFADIKARGLKPTLQDNQPSKATTQSTLQIIRQATHDDAAAQKPRPATIAAPNLLEAVHLERERALLRFPPELRAAAGRALGAIQTSTSASAPALPNGDDIAYDEASITVDQGDDYVNEGWKTPEQDATRAAELEAKRNTERNRVEGLIATTKTDFELWDVLNEEVFTMPARLGIGGSVEDKPKKRGKGRETTEDMEVADNEAADQGLSLYIHGPLYPAYLLLALRRLDTAFRAPSPLAFEVLPHIKELGLESYVLGVSTPFYNELLEIYWTRRGDLLGMMELLEEMRRCGLSFDAQTAAILDRVSWALSRSATKEASGSFAGAIMMMPEYGRNVRERLRAWREVVESSIVE
ncbi:hypothetical protein F5Y04DRAFT_85860 [Hypomontagnella monticulosa]|nr:hypothetical protein F5Y04DRAFT_85860 [Hypomontagnella monticulosa]